MRGGGGRERGVDGKTGTYHQMDSSATVRCSPWIVRERDMSFS